MMMMPNANRIGKTALSKYGQSASASMMIQRSIFGREATSALCTSPVNSMNLRGSDITHSPQPESIQVRCYSVDRTGNSFLTSYPHSIVSRRDVAFNKLSLNFDRTPLQQSGFSTLSTNTTSTAAGVDNLNATLDTSAEADGISTDLKNRLKTLDMSVVRKIKSELMEADINHDGRIDSDELKKLLRRHNSAFTDAEIVEIGDLFYASKAGGSVPFDRFIEAIDYASSNSSHPNDEGEVRKEPVHFRESRNHPLGIGSCASEFMYAKTHGHYTAEELDVKLTHVEPKTFGDRMAFRAVKSVRFLFDTATGWNSGELTTAKVLQRVIYLETIAGVPGMVAAISRHFKSLRSMQRDGGMLHMFLEEANNERMHLMTFVRMRDPSKLFRAAVIAGQFGFGTGFLLAYLVSPKFCHRFVGYIEEEACATYTKIIDAIEKAPEGSDLARWRTEIAPKIAISYWKLGEKGTVLDLMYAVRADEAEHRDVNHVVSGIKEGQVNPLYDPKEKLDQVLLKYVQDIMKTS